MLTLAVGGGGYTGVELVGEFIEWVKILCKQYNIDRKEVRLIIVEALPTVLPILNNKLKNKAVRYMEKHGVEILVNSPIVKVDPDSFTIKRRYRNSDKNPGMDRRHTDQQLCQKAGLKRWQEKPDYCK